MAVDEAPRAGVELVAILERDMGAGRVRLSVEIKSNGLFPEWDVSVNPYLARICCCNSTTHPLKL
jgi:hypothetical protein